MAVGCGGVSFFWCDRRPIKLIMDSEEVPMGGGRILKN